MTFEPPATEEPIPDCCAKWNENLEFTDWTDGITFETYECQICKRLVVIDIEIERDWDSARMVKE